jgi:hypothetical protein
MRNAICVFCSASTTVEPHFFQAARDVGTAIGQRGGMLVYGGASVGMMGVVAEATHAAGGRVFGAIPQALLDREIAYRAADELVVTADMRQRKATMDARADAFITLPGGIGTLDELFELMAMKQVGILDHKPVVLLNTDGFYDSLLAMLERMREAGFVREGYRAYFVLAATVEDAFAAIDAYQPPARRPAPPPDALPPEHGPGFEQATAIKTAPQPEDAAS